MKNNTTITTIIIVGAMLLPLSVFAQTPPPPEPPNPGIQQALGAANVTDIFTAARNGEVVNINVKIDFTPCKYIRIVRNTTGVSKKRTMTGKIAPGVPNVEDILPDAQPYWYWIQIVPTTGKEVTFGPIRVAPDTDNTGNYVNAATIYKWTLARTFQNATITWNFPSGGLKYVEILRKTNIDDYSNRNKVFTSLENTGSTVDALPDPEADYWYWISATLANGRVVTQGPVKAEFSGN